MMRRLVTAALLAAALTATPAIAQDTAPPAVPNEPPLPDPNDRSDYLMIGAGAGITADYEGSDEYRLIPGAAIRARFSGISISSRGTYLYADLIPGGQGLDIELGPIAGVRLNRTGKIKDDVVDLLPERNVAIELGGFAGVSFKGLTNPYDALTFRVDAVKDFGNAHESWVLTPTVDFSTPLSRTFFAGASLSADFVQNDFADYYFGISPADTLASGLATYNPDGGIKSWQIGLLLNQSLSGDLRKGFSLFGLGSYKRLVGDFKDSPIVQDRGSATNWFGAVGLGYSW